MKAPDSLVLGYLQERDRAKVLMSCAAFRPRTEISHVEGNDLDLTSVVLFAHDQGGVLRNFDPG
jgi:hypothetical protein